MENRVERITQTIYRIPVRLPDNPMKVLNSYYLIGEDRDLLIDTGFRCEICRDDLLFGIREIGSKNDFDVLVTHLHSDHIGLAKDIAPDDAHIYLSEIDYQIVKEKGYLDNIRLPKAGFPEGMIDKVWLKNPMRKYMIDDIDDRFIGIQDGTIFQVGPISLQVLLMPGHTPGNMMLWEPEQKIMFTGDHVLFDITPNITYWNGTEDSLGNYLNSLEKSKMFDPLIVLPAHRKTGNYRKRIDKLILHHYERIEEALHIVKKYPHSSIYEIAGHMKWKIKANTWDDFPDAQKLFAVGECMAHLDYLLVRGLITAEEKNGICFYS